MSFIGTTFTFPKDRDKTEPVAKNCGGCMESNMKFGVQLWNTVQVCSMTKGTEGVPFVMYALKRYICFL